MLLSSIYALFSFNLSPLDLNLCSKGSIFMPIRFHPCHWVRLIYDLRSIHVLRLNISPKIQSMPLGSIHALRFNPCPEVPAVVLVPIQSKLTVSIHALGSGSLRNHISDQSRMGSNHAQRFNPCFSL